MKLNTENYRDFKMLGAKKLFKQRGLNLFEESMEGFLNCKISILYEPREYLLEKIGVDVLANPNRGYYLIDENKTFIFIRILKERSLISGLGVLIIKNDINLYSNFFHKLEGSLTHMFSKAFENYFENCSLLFGDEMIKHIITKYCSSGYFDYIKFRHLVDYFIKLRSLTFEGQTFSTGLIITKSIFAYGKKRDHYRGGDLYALTKKIGLLNTFDINRRFWYLVDGKSGFYVCNKDLVISNLFVIDKNYNNYIDSHSLSESLKGGDILLKIENEKNFSIIDSDGLEFLYRESSWKLRNYNAIKKEIMDCVPNAEVVSRILFFIIYCSKNSISSVVWIPKNISSINDFVKKETLNSLTVEKVSILDDKFTNNIFRFLSSDGATIINENGEVLHYGCIVDMKNLEIKGVKGTGESAAEVLGKNGIAFKISQDGTIKVFMNETQITI